jgi:hypothetical protein
VENRVSYWNGTDRIDVTAHNAEEVGRILMDENVRSVGHRYNDRIDNDEKSAGAAYKFKRFSTPLTAVEAIKACHCLDYQSCETENWEGTIAWRILQAVLSAATHKLPGYDKAPWGVDSDAGLTHKGQVSILSLTRRGR